MIWNPMTRRMFLGQMGKFMLATPLLPSLLPKKAWGQVQNVPPRFIFISSVNGSAQNQHWFPLQEPTTNRTLLYPAKSNNPHLTTAFYNVPDHHYHYDNLIADPVSGISPLFDTKFNKFAPLMNIIRGMDIRAGSFGNHYGGALLGNFISANLSNNSHLDPWPTIDQIMAYSNSFYPNNALGFVRHVYINSQKSARAQIYNWENPISRTGNVVNLSHDYDAKKIFDKFFVGGQQPTPQNLNSSTPIIDSVIADFRSVRNSRAISSEDKIKLDSHISLLAQLEQDLQSKQNIGQNCQSVTAPPSTADSRNLPDSEVIINYKHYNDVMVAAMKCDGTRLLSYFVQKAANYGEGASNAQGSWHWASHVASGDATGANILFNIYKWISDNVLYDLVNKMDSVQEVNGKSMLENSLIHYSTATQHNAHSAYSIPCVTFGNARGMLNTGYYVDFRNRDSRFVNRGILYNRWLVTIMQAMGLSPADYSITNLGLNRGDYPPGAPGYGEYKYYDLTNYKKDWNHHEHQIPDVGKPIPVIYKG